MKKENIQKTVMLNSFQHPHHNQPLFQAEKILNQVQDDNRRGFTLIELLVVVLIIGILAAVAVPQYQVATDKARFTEVLSLAKTAKDAQEIYYLANGKYADNWEELELSFPATNISGTNLDTTTGWRVQLRQDPFAIYVRDGKIPGVVLIVGLAHASAPWTNRSACYVQGSIYKRAHTLCKNITGNEPVSDLYYWFD